MGRQPQAGDTLGRYVLEEELGRGGMAVVYRATDPTLEREVAVKVLHGHLDDIEHARRFLREARAAARLEHDSILKIHDYGGGADKDDVAAYIVAELIRGPSLQGYIARRGVLLPEVAAMVVLRLAEALSCAHDKGIVHRDVKPDNVMIAEGGRVVLTDFGIARVLEGDSVTRTGALLGSPAYMSPEQARGEPVDARSDLFALGTVLYKLCTGKLPFTAPDPLATVLRIIKGAFTPPLALNPRIGSALERVILKLLQQKREDRYQSAAELAKVLRELLADVGIDDPEAALARYFDSPGDYNRELVGHVITRSIERARTARERGEHAAALSYCDRVLAFEPQNTDALALIETLSSRRGQRRSLLYGAVALVLAGGVAGAVVLARGGGSDHGSARVGSAGSALASGDKGSGSGSSTVALASARVSDGAATRVHASGGLDAGAGSVRGTGGGVDASGSGPQLVRSTTTNPGSSSARRAGSGGRPHVRRPRRRRDAGLAHARSQPDASKNSTTPDAGAPKPKKTMLRVRIGPFCKAFIDGKAVGDSPDGPWHQVSPGPHTVRCVHPITSRTVTRTVTLAPGQRFDLVATMTSKVRVALAAGDAVKINQRLYHQGAALHVPLKRVEVVVFKGGRVLTRGWRTLRDGCVLTDSPRLGCK